VTGSVVAQAENQASLQFNTEALLAFLRRAEEPDQTETPELLQPALKPRSEAETQPKSKSPSQPTKSAPWLVGKYPTREAEDQRSGAHR